jgi:hypothetical protein
MQSLIRWAKALIYNEINSPDFKVGTIEYQGISGL